jgi:hypothetical protein
MRYICFAMLFLSIFYCLSCSSTGSGEPDKRPANVPAAATWAGGPDGGSYVLCTIDQAKAVNSCQVWNDYNGDLIESGEYTLQEQKRAAQLSELVVVFADRGGRIGLKNGMVLVNSRVRR